VLTLREGASLEQLLPNVSPLQRELDVVLTARGNSGAGAGDYAASGEGGGET